MPDSLRCCACDGRGRAGQRVDAAAGLRERDRLSDRVHAGEQRGDPVPAERDAAVWGRAKGERLQQESELLLGFGLIQPHHRENPFLNVAAVDTD